MHGGVLQTICYCCAHGQALQPSSTPGCRQTRRRRNQTGNMMNQPTSTSSRISRHPAGLGPTKVASRALTRVLVSERECVCAYACVCVSEYEYSQHTRPC